MKYLLIISAFLFFSHSLSAQKSDSTLVQVSGVIMTSDSLRAVSFASVGIEGTSRGAYANYDGVFSIVAHKGETLVFQALGFEDAVYKIPTDIKGNRISVVQLMSSSSLFLPETVVFPWPSKEFFKQDFLALDVSNKLEEIADENLAKTYLDGIAEVMVMDGNENADYFLRQQAQAAYYYGQAPPMNIFNVFAWKEFIQAWKRGDFKKKKK